MIARAVNEIHSTQDPTAHAELQAIRKAAQALGRSSKKKLEKRKK